MNRVLKTFIAISVLLNLLLAGLVIGHVGRYVIGAHKSHSWQDIAESLPEDKREDFEKTMRSVDHDTGEWHQQLSDARKKAAAMLMGETFDKTAYLAQMQTIYQLHGQIRQRTVEAVAQLAEQASPEERALLADMLRHPPHHGDE